MREVLSRIKDRIYFVSQPGHLYLTSLSCCRPDRTVSNASFISRVSSEVAITLYLTFSTLFSRQLTILVVERVGSAPNSWLLRILLLTAARLRIFAIRLFIPFAMKESSAIGGQHLGEVRSLVLGLCSIIFSAF